MSVPCKRKDEGCSLFLLAPWHRKEARTQILGNQSLTTPRLLFGCHLGRGCHYLPGSTPVGHKWHSFCKVPWERASSPYMVVVLVPVRGSKTCLSLIRAAGTPSILLSTTLSFPTLLCHSLSDKDLHFPASSPDTLSNSPSLVQTHVGQSQIEHAEKHH